MTKFWLIAAVLIDTLSAPLSYAMETTEETPLVTFGPEQFWQGEQFRLMGDFPAIVKAIKLVDPRGLESRLKEKFTLYSSISADELVSISYELLMINSKEIAITWIPLIGGNFAAACAIGQIPYSVFWLADGLTEARQWVSIIYILHHFACEYFRGDNGQRTPKLAETL